MSLPSTAKKTVLISGGSVAGPATAFWLNRYGFQTTVVERWPELRPGGQSIDVAHYGLQAIRRMGLEGELRARFTGEKGTTITDKNNKIYSQLGVGNGPTNEFEILRGDFAEMLYTETKEDTKWVFGDYIVGFDEQDAAGKVKVTFNSGKQETYDYVIIADGSRSRTRKLAFGESSFEYRPVGVYIAYFSIPLEAKTSFADQWHMMWLPGRRGIYFRPDFKANASRAGVMFMSPKSKGYEKLSPDEQKATIAELFADGGPNAEAMIKHLDASNDLYFEYLGQVHASKWSSESGRILMVGDAAWCGTPLIGMGTSLSCAGAYILAGEMATNPDDPKAAAKAYEDKWRPTVTEAQKIAPGVPGIFFYEKEWAVNTFLRVAAIAGAIFGNTIVQRVFGFIGTLWERLFPSKESTPLPEYGHLVVNSRKDKP